MSVRITGVVDRVGANMVLRAHDGTTYEVAATAFAGFVNSEEVSVDDVVELLGLYY